MNVFSQICHHCRAEDTQRSQIKANLLLYWRPGSNPKGNKRRMKKERRSRGRCIHKKMCLIYFKKIVIHSQIYHGMSE